MSNGMIVGITMSFYFKKNIMIFGIFKEFTVSIINLENFKECP